MIVRMKRVAVLCTASSEQETLDALQSLGVLHLDAADHSEAPALKESQASLDNALKSLAVLGDAEPNGTQPSGDVTPEAILASAARLEALETQIASLERHIATYGPLGDFNPTDFRNLEATGLKLRLFVAPAGILPEAAEGQIVRVLAENPTEKTVYGLAIGDVQFPDSVSALPVPEKSLKETKKELDSIRDARKAEKDVLAGYATCAEKIKDCISERTTVRDFAVAQSAMGAQDGVKWLTGYLPEAKLPALREAAAAHGWGVAARDPTDEEDPPTLIDPPKIFRPIVALFDMLGISPGYREADVSVVFYSFFTIFFAMLVGDVGYGVIILAITVWARRKFKKAPSAPFALLGVFSIATIVWGALTATYFGMPMDWLPAWLKPKTAVWLENQSNIMQLCFIIGATHLSAARIWNACALFPSRKFLAEIGWLGIIWTMFCVSCAVVVEGFAFPKFMYGVAVVSALMIAFFMLDKSELKTRGVELGMLPLNIISGLGDIISYVRLYAVGLSSVMVAQN
ncbi:MAG: hypothetical protein J5833_08775, partial [Victivallales bacterium]|nr:hypothetical protein [Victivallales bacterium]